MKRHIVTTALLLGASSLGLHAATPIGVVDYNSDTPALFGTGNPDGSWVGATNLGVAAELRFKNRTTGDFGYDGAGAYMFPTGTRVQLEWSAGSDTNLADYVFRVTVDVDPTIGISGITFTINNYTDNSFGTSTTLNGAGIEGMWDSLAGSNTIAQNSQREIWVGINYNIVGTYDVTMTGYHASDTGFAIPLVQTVATLNFIPEPSTALLGGIGILGLLRRRR